MNRSLLILAVSATLVVPAAHLAAEVPTMLNYQGYVTVNSQPFTGQGIFKFALVDRPGTSTYWSHDGTSVSGAAPTSSLTNIAVFNGLYSVLLGDRTIAGMTQPVSPSVFTDHRDIFLRVWFDDGTNGVQQLAPDTRIASVGFAMVAATVSDGAINSSALAPSLTLGATNNPGSLTLKSGGDQTRAVLDAGAQTGTGSLKMFDLTGAIETARLVGAESGAAGAQLLLKNGSGNTTLEFDAQDGGSTTAGGVVRLKRNDGNTVLALDADLGNTNSGVLLFDAAGTRETLRLTGTENGTGGGFIAVKNPSGNSTIVLHGEDPADPLSTGVIEMKQNSGKQTVALRSTFGGANGGALQLGNSAGNNTVEIAGDAGENQGRIILKRSDLSNRVRIDADGPNNSGELKLYDNDGTETIQLLGGQGTTKGAVVNLHDGDGTTTVAIDADDAWEAGRVELTRGSGERTVRLTGDLDGNGKGALQLFKGDGATETVRITGSYLGTGGGFAHFTDAAGNITVKINGEEDGEGKITTQVLQITGGSDLSERFDVVAPAHTELEPGLIVCIDPARPGGLRVSDRAADPTVAGIISGAGGVKPGMLMGQHGTKADGRLPVALTGRVYCHVDASYGAIQPGDLITTSNTPGHGMKATASQAPGAIIGKAMTALDHGRGLVLVLVSLQ